MKENSKYKNVVIKSFNDLEEVEELIGEKLLNSSPVDDFYSVAVFCKRDTAKIILEDFICCGYDISYAQFDNIDWSLKDIVYYITISNDEVGIEPAYAENGNLMGFDDTISFVYMNDCEQDIVDNCIENSREVILFDLEGDNGYEEFERSSNKDISDNTSQPLKKNLNRNGTASEKQRIVTDDNGVPKGFIKRWETIDKGVHSCSTYSFGSSDFGLLKGIADLFDVNLLGK